MGASDCATAVLPSPAKGPDKSVQLLLTSIKVAIAKVTSGALRCTAVGVPADVATGGDDTDSDGDSESDDASSVAPGDLNSGCEDSDDDA